MSRSRCSYLLLIAGLSATLCSAQAKDPKPGVGISADWSHSHLVVNNAAAAEGWVASGRDPRMLSTLAARIAMRRRAAAQPDLSGDRSKGGPQRGKHSIKQDWNFALGAGRVAPTMSPAKFNFVVNSTVTAANCTTDYVVYALDVPGNVLATIAASPTGAVRSGNVVTITTTAAHNFSVGYTVTVAGVTDLSFNGTFTIASVPSTTTFTYAQVGSNATSGSGTVTMQQGNLVALNNLYSGSQPAGNNGLCGSGSGTIAASPTGAVRSGNAVSITTTAAHGLLVGQWSTITGVTDTSFNGSYQVMSVPTSTSFTYAQVAPDATSGSGSANVTASINWAYDTSSAICGGGSATCAGDGNFTSPAISFDNTGAKVAFVESVSDATASCPGRLGTGACSILHVLKWTSGEGTVLAPDTPGLGGSTASMVSITYASATNTSSSPWIDYSNDAAYIGADDGKLYRITGVFNATPTLDTNFGDTPGTAGVTITAGQKLSPPVDIVGAGLDTGFVFLSDAPGNLKALNVATRTLIGTGIVVGGGSTVPAVLDAPLVYYDPAGDPTHISVFAVSSNTNNTDTFPSGAPSLTVGAGAIVQGVLDSSALTFSAVSGVGLGDGTGTQVLSFHSPAFDDTFYTPPTSGFLYTCGTQASQPWPMLYRIGFNTPLASSLNLVPTLNAGAVNSAAIAAFTTNAECSPLTEFANPNLSITDILFFGVSGSVQRLYSWNISGALQPTPIITGGVGEPGGTSAIIVDNTQASSGNGTSQGSSIYFTTLAPSNSCGTNVMCAVKLRQVDLK